MIAQSINEFSLRNKLLKDNTILNLLDTVDIMINTSYDHEELKSKYPMIKWTTDQSLFNRTESENRLGLLYTALYAKYDYIYIVNDSYVFNPDKLSMIKSALKSGTRGMVNFTDKKCSDKLFHTWMRCGLLINVHNFMASLHALEDDVINLDPNKLLEVEFHSELIFASILWLGGYDVTYIVIDDMMIDRSHITNNESIGKHYSNNPFTMKHYLMELGLMEMDHELGVLYPSSNSVTHEIWTKKAYDIRRRCIDKRV